MVPTAHDVTALEQGYEIFWAESWFRPRYICGGCRRVVMQGCCRFVADGADALDVLDVAAVVAEG
jgi:hypothetical protein